MSRRARARAGAMQAKRISLVGRCEPDDDDDDDDQEAIDAAESLLIAFDEAATAERAEPAL